MSEQNQEDPCYNCLEGACKNHRSVCEVKCSKCSNHRCKFYKQFKKASGNCPKRIATA